MKFLKRRKAGLTTLALFFSVLQVYVAGASLPPTPPAAPKRAVQSAEGRLITLGNKVVTVDGNSASTGDTIFSGQKIQTPPFVSATVEIGVLGRVEIDRGTYVKISFGDQRIDAEVIVGCVTLTTYPGTAGALLARQNSGVINPLTGGTLSNCMERRRRRRDRDAEESAPAGGDAGGSTAPASTGAGGGLGSTSALLLTTAVVGVFIVVVHEVVSDSENPEPAPCTPVPPNPSPSVPNGCAT